MNSAWLNDPETAKEIHPPATWLDAMPVDKRDSKAGERDTSFHSDDNGLYRMFLPETI